MMAPNPRSLGDNFPDDPRFLKSDGADRAEQNDGDAQAAASSGVEQGFQNPMTEQDTASGGPADPVDD